MYLCSFIVLMYHFSVKYHYTYTDYGLDIQFTVYMTTLGVTGCAVWLHCVNTVLYMDDIVCTSNKTHVIALSLMRKSVW